VSARDLLKRPCPGCPFTADSIVSPARVRNIVEDARRNDAHFICHKSVEGPTLVERLPREMTCRGFLDAVHQKDGTGNLLRIIGRLGGFVEYELTPEEEHRAATTLTPYRKQRKP
jgi:hypothetical protein